MTLLEDVVRAFNCVVCSQFTADRAVTASLRGLHENKGVTVRKASILTRVRITIVAVVVQ